MIMIKQTLMHGNKKWQRKNCKNRLNRLKDKLKQKKIKSKRRRSKSKIKKNQNNKKNNNRQDPSKKAKKFNSKFNLNLKNQRQSKH